MLAALALAAAPALAQMRVMAQPNHSPLVTFRIVFTTGSGSDPTAKPGLAYLTAQMIAGGGSKTQTYQQITDAMFPMSAEFGAQVDKEMSTFAGSTHTDNLEAYYKLIHGMLLEPGWREDDFKRVKDDCISAIKSGLRNNDEELAKEVLYGDIYQGMSYGHYNGGTVTSLEAITLEDVKRFYEGIHRGQPDFGHFGRLFTGISGTREERLPPLASGERFSRAAHGAEGYHGEPGDDCGERRARDGDFARLSDLVHAPESGFSGAAGGGIVFRRASHERHVLYDELREKRGLNYGDYAYIEISRAGCIRWSPARTWRGTIRYFRSGSGRFSPPRPNSRCGWRFTSSTI